jgi:hypothetical protein
MAIPMSWEPDTVHEDKEHPCHIGTIMHSTQSPTHEDQRTQYSCLSERLFDQLGRNMPTSHHLPSLSRSLDRRINSKPPVSTLHCDCPSSCSCSLSIIIVSMLKYRASSPYPFSAPRNRPVGSRLPSPSCSLFRAGKKVTRCGGACTSQRTTQRSRALRNSIFFFLLKRCCLTSSSPPSIMVPAWCGS